MNFMARTDFDRVGFSSTAFGAAEGGMEDPFGFRYDIVVLIETIGLDSGLKK
jgi:hypothetical protein